MVRFFAKVAPSEGPLAVKHYQGLPPELIGGEETRTPLPRASALLIEEQPSGIYLFRLTSEGQIVGDTWHQTIGDAKHQAEYEYGETLADWEDMPEDVTDAIQYIVSWHS